jgi:Zn-dependent peptidase ImmA (M78 family)
VNKTSRIPVTPEVLVWARESISLSTEAAAKRIGVSQNILTSWEDGSLEPTIAQLRTASEKYKRPLAVLLLSTPPRDFDAMRDFRRQSGDSNPWSPELHGEFRRALDQREVFLELADDAPDSMPTTVSPPVLATHMNVEIAGNLLREYLELTISEQLKWKDPYKALNTLIDRVEERGIIVIHAKGVSIDEMRAFSISERPYPVIALNGSDFPRARVFSLFHELTHLALSNGGLCDLHEGNGQRHHSAGDGSLEHFCNQVAAAALMPSPELLSQLIVENATSAYDWNLEELEKLASRFQVSQEALLLRLVTLDKANWSTYRLRKDELREQYATAAALRRERRRIKPGGPDFYKTKARDIGHGYASVVLDAFGGRSITSRDVADFLDIKFGQIERLQAELR